MLFNLALEYAIRWVQVSQDDLKLNGTHQLLAYADDVNILGGSIHTLKENAEALVATNREIGLEVRADHLGVDVWIILGWISRRWDVGIWTGLGWPRIETVHGHVSRSACRTNS